MFVAGCFLLCYAQPSDNQNDRSQFEILTKNELKMVCVMWQMPLSEDNPIEIVAKDQPFNRIFSILDDVFVISRDALCWSDHQKSIDFSYR